jgi:hypothetical protein
MLVRVRHPVPPGWIGQEAYLESEAQDGFHHGAGIEGLLLSEPVA